MTTSYSGANCVTECSVQALPAFSADPTSNRETPNSDPYIQDLVRKSEEKKEERYQARLNDYYRRNFKEYFQVQLL